MNVLLKIMTLSSDSNPTHFLKARVDGSRQAAHQVIPLAGGWHPVFWTGITALSTLALLGLEAVVSQTANAQAVNAQNANAQIINAQNAWNVQNANAQTAIVQLNLPAANAQPVNNANDQLSEIAEVTESDALELLNEAVNQSTNHSNDAGEYSAIDPLGIYLDANLVSYEEKGNEFGNEAIDEFEELSLNRSEPDQSDSDSSEFNEERIAAETETTNQPNTISIAQANIAQSNTEAQYSDPNLSPADGESIAQGGSALLGAPFVHLQGAIVVQGDEFSARARTTASYAITPNLLVGGTVDLVTGDTFTDSPESGLNLNELYVAVSPSEIPTLRFAVGLLDYTSYFDRNSFAKDGVTQFFNPIFQTNPALAAAGLSSRPGVLVNWTVTDHLELRAAGFSSRRDLGDFALDGFAAEAAVRIQNLILRGTYLTAEDAGDDSGFREIFQFDRGDNDFGLRSGDREQAYGINAEYFVPSIRLGLFARYGWYDNLDLERGGETYSFGFNLLDLFLPDDRLGLAYGRDLSNEGLRKRRNDDLPDVVELFYDARLLPYLRAGFTAQARNSFSETILGFRVRADFTLSDLGRAFQ